MSEHINSGWSKIMVEIEAGFRTTESANFYIIFLLLWKKKYRKENMQIMTFNLPSRQKNMKTLNSSFSRNSKKIIKLLGSEKEQLHWIW